MSENGNSYCCRRGIKNVVWQVKRVTLSSFSYIIFYFCSFRSLFVDPRLSVGEKGKTNLNNVSPPTFNDAPNSRPLPSFEPRSAAIHHLFIWPLQSSLESWLHSFLLFPQIWSRNIHGLSFLGQRPQREPPKGTIPYRGISIRPSFLRKRGDVTQPSCQLPRRWLW